VLSLVYPSRTRGMLSVLKTDDLFLRQSVGCSVGRVTAWGSETRFVYGERRRLVGR
jgi:hypothetical protein